MLGGATLVLFGTIAVAGIRILASEPIDRGGSTSWRSFGLGLGVVAGAGRDAAPADFIKQVVATPITLAGLSAIILSLVIPESASAPIDPEESIAPI